MKKNLFVVMFAFIFSCDLIAGIKYYSQLGQDKWVINEVFKGKKDGFFLDVGSADGVFISNTYALEKHLNWHGICVEANPIYYDHLVKNRDCICINHCLDSEEHEVEFMIQSTSFAKIFGPKVDGRLFGGIIDDDTDNNQKIRKKYIDEAFKQIT